MKVQTRASFTTTTKYIKLSSKDTEEMFLQRVKNVVGYLPEIEQKYDCGSDLFYSCRVVFRYVIKNSKIATVGISDGYPYDTYESVDGYYLGFEINSKGRVVGLQLHYLDQPGQQKRNK